MSLRKTKGASERKDFEESVKEITGKKYLNTKRSLLTQQGEHHRRYQSEIHQP
jgi:hypothetical protein